MPVRGSRMSALCCLVVMLSASQIQAQESEIPSRLTLEDAIRLVIARNPSLAAAKNEVQALEGDTVAASKRLNPAVSLQMENFPDQCESRHRFSAPRR